MIAGMLDVGVLADRAEEAGQWDLLRRAQAGDVDAFARIYEAQRGFVFGYLSHRLTDRHTIDDLTAETFTRAWRARDSVSHQRSEVGAWLVTIARNLLVDYRKAAARRELLTAEPHRSLTKRQTSDPGPEALAMSGETARALQALLAHLTDDQRRCLLLRFWAGLSNREIATTLQRNEAAVKMLQQRALAKLRLVIGTQTDPSQPVIDGGFR